MKIFALLACLGLLFAVPTVTGATLTKSGPPATSADFCHGGGGGPKVPTSCMDTWDRHSLGSPRS